jgi:hypothetical protein
MRTAKSLAMQHPGNVDIGTVFGATGYLVYAVVAYGPCAYYLE